MIADISNELYSAIKTALLDVDVKMAYDGSEPAFPCVTFMELSDTEDETTICSSGVLYVELSYEINIFTTGESKVSQSKTIRNAVDGIMSGTYGLRRTDSRPVPNYLDESIHRHVLRYKALVSRDKTIYRG